MTFDPSKWNPRYLAYARSNKTLDPDAMLEKDNRRMDKFMSWISEHWREFGKLRPEMNPELRTEEDHKAFTAWLEKKYP